MSVAKGYGQEIPIDTGHCEAGDSCTYTTSESISTTQTWTVNAGVGLGTGDEISKALTASFDAGASYSWSKSITYTTGIGEKRDVFADQCGCKLVHSFDRLFHSGALPT